jgi:DNA-binding IclR family transcriptional regulator
MQTISRTISILSQLQNKPEGIGVVQIADETYLPASSVHRILQSLLKHDLVWQDPDSRLYSPGLKLLEMGWAILGEGNNQRWRQYAHWLLANLSLRLEEQVFLGMLIHETVVIVESIAPSEDGKTPIAIPCMDQSPVHCGSSAKVILAYLPNQMLRRIVTHCSFRPYTMYTLADRQELMNHLHTVRERGYATCLEEFSHDSYALSVPLLDINGQAFASVGVGPLHSRLDTDAELDLVSQLRRIAVMISVEALANRETN